MRDSIEDRNISGVGEGQNLGADHNNAEVVQGGSEIHEQNESAGYEKTLILTENIPLKLGDDHIFSKGEGDEQNITEEEDELNDDSSTIDILRQGEGQHALDFGKCKMTDATKEVININLDNGMELSDEDEGIISKAQSKARSGIGADQ